MIVHMQLLFCVVKQPAVPTSATASTSAIPSTLSSAAARRRQPAPALHCALSPARLGLWSGEVTETVLPVILYCDCDGHTINIS